MVGFDYERLNEHRVWELRKEAARLSAPIEGLAPHAGEMEVERTIAAMAAKNISAGSVPSFLGAGAYRHHVPAAVDHLIQRGEFLTAYTPYQPEIAQGTLQMLFEFQTQVARLYGCEVANASMYDGSTACWEAIGMARRITRRTRTLISSGLHPHYVSVAKTMARFTGDQLDTALPELAAETDAERLIAAIDGETSAVVVQYPDILGRIADLSPIAEAAGRVTIEDTEKSRRLILTPDDGWPVGVVGCQFVYYRQCVAHCYTHRDHTVCEVLAGVDEHRPGIKVQIDADVRLPHSGDP